MRLIDADEVINYLKSVIESVTDKEFKEEVTRTMDAVKGLLDTFDEPIPRCKDCKYWTKVERTYYVCNVQGCGDDDGNSCWRTLPSDFCSRGERVE